MTIKIKMYGNIPIYYRPGTTDEKVIREVIDCRAYRKPSAEFDVEEGEHWLDLGANIGSFAVYCKLRGATADCYEPEPGCFSLLTRNASGFSIERATVSHLKEKSVSLFTSSIKGNHYRGTLMQGNRGRSNIEIQVPNRFIGSLRRRYDGIKMDIEGSEFGIIDGGLIPRCNKLCFEYHTSRDKSMENLKRRIGCLKKCFEVVSYVPELDRIMALGGEQKSFHDRVIYCRNPK